MNDIKHYYTELYAKGFKYTNKFSGFYSVCAHFSTRAKVGTMTFEQAKQEGIEFTGNQQTSHGWVDYTVGKTFTKTGNKEVTASCPSYFEGHRSQPIYEEV
tara:strand:+ start:83 stop:385 length:303 start_codon:yes stop_codon:yes gene_type:complete